MAAIFKILLSIGILMVTAAANTCSRGDSRSIERPNILFIMTDQQFAGAMSCVMDGQYIQTPAMDSLAASGTLFTRAYVANPICMPSRNSIFTGRYPHETGITANFRRELDTNEFVNMGTYLRQAGYETAYYGKWHLSFDQENVQAHGFEQMGRGSDKEVAEQAAAFLRQAHEGPFLLVASFLNPHNICEYARGEPLPLGEVGDPPPADQLPPAPSNLQPAANEPDTMTVMRKSYHNTRMTPVGNFDEVKWRQVRWAYYRMIEMVDAEIGRVLAALRQADLEESTLIIFTSDHGEVAGAHGFHQKTVFYEESARVPLIVSLKGVTQTGHSGALVNTGVDILPTMLDFAGIEKPAKLPGRSLRQIATGDAPSPWREYVVVGNNMIQGGPVGPIRPTTEGRMVRSDRYKYAVYSFGNQRESLVDLANDPHELVNLVGDPAHRQALEAHRRMLSEFGSTHDDALAAELATDPVTPRPFVDVPQ